MGEHLKEKVKELLNEVQPKLKVKDEESELQMMVSGKGNIQAAGAINIEVHSDPTKVSGPNIVHCPDCGHDVSIRAEACTHCGCPVNKHFQQLGARRVSKYLGFILLVLVIIALFLPKPYNICVALAACMTFYFLLRAFAEVTDV